MVLLLNRFIQCCMTNTNIFEYMTAHMQELLIHTDVKLFDRGYLSSVVVLDL